MPATLTGFFYCIMGTTIRTITIRVCMKYRLQSFLNQQYDRHLGYTVTNRRNAQGTSSSGGFRYIYQLYSFGKITSRTHAVPQLVQILSQITLIVLCTDIVDTGTPLVFFYPFPSIHYQILVDCKRFCDLMLHHPNNINQLVVQKQIHRTSCPLCSIAITATSTLLRGSPPPP